MQLVAETAHLVSANFTGSGRETASDCKESWADSGAQRAWLLSSACCWWCRRGGCWRSSRPRNHTCAAMVRSIGLTLSLEGLTLSPELGSQLSRIWRETSVNCRLRVRVLDLSQAPAMGSADELVALTSGFGGLTIDAPVVLSAETRGY